MTDDKLEKAKELKVLIDATRGATESLENWQDSSQRGHGARKIDENYNLVICKHGDGSGAKLNLTRYYGNTRLLEVIRKELEAQLDEFEKEYAEL